MSHLAGALVVPSLCPPHSPFFSPIPRGFLAREDVGMILISQALAEQIRPAVAAHARALPAVLEIPSKDHPYDPARDSVLRRARGLFAPDELR